MNTNSDLLIGDILSAAGTLATESVNQMSPENRVAIADQLAFGSALGVFCQLTPSPHLSVVLTAPSGNVTVLAQTFFDVDAAPSN